MTALSQGGDTSGEQTVIFFFSLVISADLAIDRALRIWVLDRWVRPGTAEQGGILIGKPGAMVDARGGFGL